MRRSMCWFVLLVLMFGFCSAASGQERFQVGLRLGLFEGSGSSDTFDAVYGGDNMTQIGVDLRVRLGRSWRLHVAADQGTLDGELVTVLPTGEVFGSGTETELSFDSDSPVPCQGFPSGVGLELVPRGWPNTAGVGGRQRVLGHFGK